MRLGVSPAATSTPTGVFNQRLEASFPSTGALGCVVYFAPLPFLLVYLCTNVGPWVLLAVSLPAPLVPQSASLWIRPRCHESCPPRLPISAPLTGLDVSSLSPWLFDFHAVQLSVSSGCFLFLNCCPSFGCVRRCSVSTYTSILVFSHEQLLFKPLGDGHQHYVIKTSPKADPKGRGQGI